MNHRLSTGLTRLTLGLTLGLTACGDGEEAAGADGRVFVFDEGGSVTWIEPDPNLSGSADCEAQCPNGTQRLAFDATNPTAVQTEVDGGAFLIVEGACEAFCTPVQPCLPPSVPVVDGGGYRCEALAGFSTIAPAAEVDLSFGTLWEDAEHVP